MKKYILVVVILLFILTSNAKNCSAVESEKNAPSELTDEGNKLLSNGQFNAAITVWQKVLEQDPDNANANFKLGMCYYNSIDEQPKALLYLKKAAKNLSSKYNFFDVNEKAAPYDVLYFLGQTYLTVEEADSAMMMFFQYEDQYLGDPPIPVAKAIRNCINAKNSSKNFRDITLKNPGKNVNSSYTETNAVLTLDNSVMFFASRRNSNEGNKQISPVTGKFDEDIYFTQKDASGNWDKAVPFQWNTGQDEAPLCLSSDGLTLYFYKVVNGQKDIFQSNYIDKVWSQPKELSEINSSANESGISISSDGKYLYFSSDREGGNGNYDIYQCVKSGKKWGAPKNLGLMINTSSGEITPFINPNGKTLFFSSNGYADGMGGYDIFYSELKDDGTWTKPETMGYPINTTRDDFNYYIVGGGTRYYSTIRHENDGYDIFKIEGGGFPIENIDATGQVVTLTKEMSVTDVLEVEKTVEKEVEVIETIETTVEIIKEVEKVDIEKEQRMLDSLTTLANNKAQLDLQKIEAEKAKAEADKLKAEADIKKAEADKLKAEADIKKAEAEKAQADAEKAKEEAQKAASDAEKAKSDEIISAENAKKAAAEAEKAKADAVIQKAEADKQTAEADKIKAQADIATAESDKIKAQATIAEADIKKAEAQKAKEEADKAKAEEEIVSAKAKEAEANASKAKAEADKSKTDAEKAKSEADKIKFAAEKAKSEEETLKQKVQLAEAEKPKYEAQKAQAEADKVKAEADKLQSQAAKANAMKAKEEAKKARSNEKIAVAEAKKAEALAKKAEADARKAEAEKAKGN